MEIFNLELHEKLHSESDKNKSKKTLFNYKISN